MSNIATMPTNPTPQTAKGVIAANLQLLIEQFEAGHSEGLASYLTAMGKFHNCSFGNILEIVRQKQTQPARRDLCVEPAWPHGYERTEAKTRQQSTRPS